MEKWYLQYNYKGLQVLENGQSTCLRVYVAIEVVLLRKMLLNLNIICLTNL
jgi:hypothetical protein